MNSMFLDQEPDEDEERQLVACNRCGAEGLEWIMLSKSEFILWNPNNTRHDCSVANAEDFD
ncbi:hypothetical protein ACO0LM_12010 [Undibacterium sp. Di26W]|uniref:hypothetical protein n=1 Tax=Undibacterium sp. Di26W TaxID=3413035 RepID=UPI003BF269CE